MEFGNEENSTAARDSGGYLLNGSLDKLGMTGFYSPNSWLNFLTMVLRTLRRA